MKYVLNTSYVTKNVLYELLRTERASGLPGMHSACMANEVLNCLIF